ncbi:MAG: PAS domain S-box protein [Pseudomonadota bacterium]
MFTDNSRKFLRVFSLVLFLLCLLLSNAYAIDLSSAEKDYLRKKNTIVFVSQTQYPPFEFIDENRQHEGMMLDVIRWMAVEMSFQPVFIDMPFQQAQEAVIAGRADIITSLFLSEKRKEDFAFTEALFNVPASIFVKAERTDIKDLKDLRGKIIAIQKGDYAKEYLESQKIPFVPLDTQNFAEATDRVISAQADAIIGDEQIVLYHIFSNHLTYSIKKINEPLYIGRNCMASKKDHAILISILNKGIDAARKTGVLEKISKKWLGTTYGHQKSFLESYILPFSAAAGCLLLVSVGVWVWNIKLRILVRKKTDVILQREKALFESERNFRTFFDTMDDIILVSSQDGRICYSNPAASIKLNYSRDELKKMYMVEVRPSEVRQEAAECFSAICKGEVNACLLPLQNKTGVVIPSQSTCWRGQWNKNDCVFFISRDLSKEQEALQKFNRVFNNNPALMSMVSLPDKKFTDINDAFSNALGFSREEILGKTSNELHFFIDQEESRRFAEESQRKGGISNSEFRIRCKNGMILDGLFSGEVIKSQGQQFFLTVMIDQTKRKQTERALRESEERFRSIFDNSLDGIVIATPDGTIFAANPAICSMLGFSEQEFCEGGRDLVVDKTDPRLAQALQELERTEKFKGEIYHRRKDGLSVPIEISIKVFSLEKGEKRKVIIYRDVTDRKRAEDKLVKVMREQQTILETANIGIIMVKDRIQRWVNRKAIDMFQYRREEMEGMPTRKLYPAQEEYERLAGDAYPVLAQGDVYETEQQLLRHDGTLIWARLNGKAIEPSDLSMGIIWLLEDITERKSADEILKATLHEKEILLREVHHRVKNNMQMISSLFSLQAERMETEAMRQVFIESQQRILTMAMIHETLYSSQDLASTDLSDYVKRLVSHLQGVYSSQAAVDIILELNKVELNIDLIVPCGLIINELLTNAFKHAFPGGGKGTIQIKNSLVNERELVLEVSDNGVGLPADLDFENPSTLGLKLVKGLLKYQLQGNWDVTVGGGTTFILRWPLPVLKSESV